MADATARTLSIPSAADSVSGSAISFDLHAASSVQRRQLETYIAKQYRLAYGAEITSFLPILFSMTANSVSQAVLGLRPACCQPLFLEQYLATPVEQRLADALKQPVSRRQMIEIGNLAASTRGASLPLFVVMTAAIERAHYRWMLFTATPEVEKLIKRLDYSPIYLCDASAEQLGQNAGSWGSYYKRAPQVMAGDTKLALQALQASPRSHALLDYYDSVIETLAQCLRDHRRVCGA